MYQVRRVNIGKSQQIDELAHECGKLYSQTVVFFWRTVRHKGIWLAPKHLMRVFSSKKLHAHTSDACVQSFFAALKSWRERRKSDPEAKPPRKRKWYFRIEYKSTAMRHKENVLTLSNGRGNAPLVLDWPWETPKTVVIHWTGTEYEAIATYTQEGAPVHPTGDRVAGIKLITTLSADGVQTLVIGDVRDIRQDLDVGGKSNQKVHQWSHGSVRHMLTYKAQRHGMGVALQEESYTSRTCPQCGHRRKSPVQRRNFHCSKCGFKAHRDMVGAMNIRYKYREEFGRPHVVAEMAPAAGIRYMPHTGVARERLRENVCVGNCTEAATALA